MKKFGFEPGPLVLAFVLGSLLEENLRRSLLLFGGDTTGFVTRPISGVLLLLFVLVLLLPLIQKYFKKSRAGKALATASQKEKEKETV
jgi:putative tricarboxylic transport membrane protein